MTATIQPTTSVWPSQFAHQQCFGKIRLIFREGISPQKGGEAPKRSEHFGEWQAKGKPGLGDDHPGKSGKTTK